MGEVCEAAASVAENRRTPERKLDDHTERNIWRWRNELKERMAEVANALEGQSLGCLIGRRREKAET